MLAVLAAVGVFLVPLRLRGFDGAFQVWNVPGYGVPFLDWALITGSAQSLAQGFDPAIQNPGDPVGRLFNYPRIWYALLRMPMTRALDVPIGICIVVIFLLAVMIYPRRATWLTESLLFLALISPAVMLGYDRANVDLLVFALMVAGLLLVDRHALGALAALLVAILFKIFPVLGAAFLLDSQRKGGLKLVAAAVAFTALYFAFTLRDMVRIFQITQKGFQEAYGVAVLPGFLQRLAQDPDLRRGPALFRALVTDTNAVLLRAPYLPYVVAIFFLFLLGYLGLRGRLPVPDADPRNLRAFWMGAGVYIGTFLLGNNFDYRLIFLLLTLPQLADWASRRQPPRRWLSILALVLLFEALCELLIKEVLSGLFAFGPYYANIMNEVAHWGLYAMLIFLFASSLPEWIFQDIGSHVQRLFGRRHSTVTPKARGPEA